MHPLRRPTVFPQGMKQPDHGRRALAVALRTAGPADYDAENPPTPGVKSTVSPIRYELPTFETRRVWFEKIAMPSSITAAAGDALWYGLARITPDTGPTGFGQEFVLSSGSLSLRPADVDNTYNAGDGVPWGSTLGFGARIVIGRNLPFSTLGTWQAAPAPAAGLCASGGSSIAPGLVSAGTSPNWIFEQPFPTGKLADTSPAMIERDIPMSADQCRIVNGQSLDVALVVRQSATLIAAGAGKFLYGFAAVTLRLGHTKNVNQVFRALQD